MRILLVSEDIPYKNMGGLAKHVLNLARALVRAGHEVDLLGNADNPIEVCGDEGKFGGRFFGELSGQHAGWKESALGVYMPMKRSIIAKRFAQTVLKRAADYDVIHYHGHYPNIAHFLPKTINFVQTRHDQGSDCLAHTRFRRGEICNSIDPAECASCIRDNPNMVQRAVSKIAVIQFRREVMDGFKRHKTVFVSDRLVKNYARTAGPGHWGTTIHNFIDRDFVEQIRRNANPSLRDGKVNVFIAGKIYPPKGIEAFLRAIASRLPDHIRITIAGDGPDEQRLRNEFESEQIRFLGWTEPLLTLNLASQADIVVVPSIWEEPCATTVLEGLFLGKPVFALNLGGTPELGIYAAHESQLRLHSTMDALVDDLLTYRPQSPYGFAPVGAGSADAAAASLLKLYQFPVDSNSTTSTNSTNS